MKQVMKRGLSALLALVMVFTMNVAIPQTATQVEASSVYYDHNCWVYTYKPGDGVRYYTVRINIMGCDSASQIKKLKSSNKSVCTVKAKDSYGRGYIEVKFKDKAGKARISCNVKGKSLSKVFTVKKYSNPVSKFKLGSKNFTSKFNKTDSYRQKAFFENKTLSITAKKGWKIRSVYAYDGHSMKFYTLNKSSFKKKVSLTARFHAISVTLYNSKTGESEYLSFGKTNS